MFVLRHPSETYERTSSSRFSDSSSVFGDNGNKCGKCQNHDFEVLKKGHARECPYKRCECYKCRLLDARSDILQVISGKETKLKGTKKDPHCGYCQNHGVQILRKGHVRSCIFGQERHFQLDDCFDCKVHYIRNEVNRLQIKMRRAMKEDKTLSEEQKRATREPITGDEVEKVCTMARIARLEHEQKMRAQQAANNPSPSLQVAGAPSSGANLISSPEQTGAGGKACALGSPSAFGHLDGSSQSSGSPQTNLQQFQQLQNKQTDRQEVKPSLSKTGPGQTSKQLANNQNQPKLGQHTKQTKASSSTSTTRNKSSLDSSIESLHQHHHQHQQIHNKQGPAPAAGPQMQTQSQLHHNATHHQLVFSPAERELAARGQVWRPWSEQQVAAAAAMQTGADQAQLNSFLAEQFRIQQDNQKEQIINLWAQQNQQHQQQHLLQQQHQQHQRHLLTLNNLEEPNFQHLCSPPSSPSRNLNNAIQQQQQQQPHLHLHHQQLQQQQQQHPPQLQLLQTTDQASNDLIMAASNLQAHTHNQQHLQQPIQQNNNQQQQQLQLANAISLNDHNIHPHTFQDQFNGIIGLILAQITQLKNRTPHE